MAGRWTKYSLDEVIDMFSADDDRMRDWFGKWWG